MKHSTNLRHSRMCNPHFHPRRFHPFLRIPHSQQYSQSDHRRNLLPSVLNSLARAELLSQLPLFFCQSSLPHSLSGSHVQDISVAVTLIFNNAVFSYESEAIECLCEGVEHYRNQDYSHCMAPPDSNTRGH